MAQSDISRSDSGTPGVWPNPTPGAASSSGKPPWLADSVVEFRRTQRNLDLVGPIKALSFGGTLLFIALLAFLLHHSPKGQSVLLVVSLLGLPLCLAAWIVARSVHKRLRRTKNHIGRRMYGAGIYVDDQGRVLTDSPHPVLVLDPAKGKTPNIS